VGQDDAHRFAEVIIRNYGMRALDLVQLSISLLEREQRYSAAKLWREVADAIEKIRADDPEHAGGN
jgi:hypothetical protein